LHDRVFGDGDVFAVGGDELNDALPFEAEGVALIPADDPLSQGVD